MFWAGLVLKLTQLLLFFYLIKFVVYISFDYIFLTIPFLKHLVFGSLAIIILIVVLLGYYLLHYYINYEKKNNNKEEEEEKKREEGSFALLLYLLPSHPEHKE